MIDVIIYISSWFVAATIGIILICALVALLQEIVTHSRRQKQLDRIEDMLKELTANSIIDKIKRGNGLPPMSDNGGKE